MLHLPLLRAGQPYKSLNVVPVRHFSSGDVVAEVSYANQGLIAADLAGAGANARALRQLSSGELLSCCTRASKLFMEADLPAGENAQSPHQYVRQLSATTGMPESLCVSNMHKIARTLEHMHDVLGGLTRGLDLNILDSGYGSQFGRDVSYQCQANALGAVLPSNSPGVHALWIPAVALKVPLVLRPGSQEPWSPFRIAQALLAAGLPREAISFYPCDYAGATEILMRCDRSMIFGDESTVGPWKGDHRVQIHGPGWSKVIFGEDQIGSWREHVDLMVSSVCENGGRSCINASGVWVPAQGRELAEALAREFVKLEARSLDDPEARLAAFANRRYALRLSELIDGQLAAGGAVDVTAQFRPGNRVVEKDGATFLLPTVILCKDPGHALARAEYLFPFVSVVEVPQQNMLQELGPTLVATVLSDDPDFVAQLLAAPQIERLNLGPIPTPRIAWDQPHEGNLFEHLYRQRALQAAGGLPAA